ncbi:MAG: molybdopterin molybdotransferase MoeA [Acidobacteria bacterium]|nr:molybdopterin molybdotransferase MoeA [Acidobacteriota bacterium]
MLSLDEAREVVLAGCTVGHPRAMPLADALGLVTSVDIDAAEAVPPFDNTAMDGFAVRAADTSSATPDTPAHLTIVGTLAAGAPPDLTVGPGQAVRIMTGAPLPVGADAVVMVELTDGGTKSVTVHESPKTGAHIRRRGEVLSTGQPLLPAGRRLTAGALALVASHGYGQVPVHRAPRVRTLATGDEVVPPETTPGPGQLRDSHTDFLLAAGRSLGLAFEPLGIAPDREADLDRLVARGLEADVLLLSGGVSMGEFDLVEGVLGRLGCTILFDQVAIQPAKPLVAAVHPGGLVFGLPGNPASAMVAFWLFVRPALRRLLGHTDAYWHGALAAELDAPLPGAKGRDRFLPAEVEIRSGRLLATPVAPVGSHDQATYAKGSALVRIPAHSSPAPTGSPCEILPLVDWRLP